MAGKTYTASIGSREVYERALGFARERQTSLAWIVEVGLEAVMAGSVPLPHRPRYRQRPQNEAARSMRGVSHSPGLVLSRQVTEDVCDAAARTCLSPEQALDHALNAMLDELERHPTSWCRKCTERIGDCGCR